MHTTFDQWLGIAGLVVGVVGSGLSALSFQKMKTARKAQKEVELKFMRYMAAQEFEKLAVQVASIMDKIARGEWESATEIAHNIGPAFALARGARSRLLTSLEKDKLDGAGINLQNLIAALPVPAGNANPGAEQTQRMITQCQSLVDIAGELAGRLHVESILQPEDHK